MAIKGAAKKAQPHREKGTQSDVQAMRSEKVAKPAQRMAPLAGHGERSATVRLYVKDRELLKEAKMAALEDDTSLSQLWEEWAVEWLKKR
ncbi:hypothetical protein [Corynebacterium doosanense]|uniref:Uncharacterized protein n=1 Tax=Corynebacterium doosanense CAU 212 = DSM 45436 TaxID=558173 RepID=A0A097IJU0_9CORY|nr:hypothetical protein [Corynebacterium doosanense]AIT62368.1 hypothetical protein CDOO_13340 [Corynebacterium doosanense CAU 212 = DSM 45436]